MTALPFPEIVAGQVPLATFEEMVNALAWAFREVNPLRDPERHRALFECYLVLLRHEGEIRG